jgi:hypothetical protein
MEWGSICVLVFLIIFYVGVTVAIIIAVVQSPLALSPGVIIFIIFMIVLVSFLVSCIVYYIVRACNIGMISVHPHPHPDPPPNHLINLPLPTHPPKPILLHSKPGTLIQHPDGDLQIAIYEHPTIQNQDPPQCALTSSVPTTKQEDLETCTTSATTSTN